MNLTLFMNFATLIRVIMNLATLIRVFMILGY
jgi:hypothetical protein